MTEGPARSFRSVARFRTWLARHGATTPALVVRLFRVAAAARDMTYAQALDRGALLRVDRLIAASRAETRL